MSQSKSPTIQSNPIATVPQLKHKNLLILVGGSKGGPGKTTAARGIADILIDRQIKFSAIDSDTENSQLHRHYSKSISVERIDLTDSETMVDFLKDLTVAAQQPEASQSLNLLSQPPEPLLLVDLPSGAEGKFRRFEDEFALFSVFDQIGYDVTFVSVMSTIKDSVNALRLLLELTQGQPNIHHVAIQNLHYGEARKFDIFDQSETKKVLKERGLLLTMPELHADTYSEIDKHNLTFRDAAAAESPLFIINRSYTYRWLAKFEAELEKAGAWLGL